jgi:hypothetical protein
MAQQMDSTSVARLAALAAAPKARWVALSADESRIVADADTFQAVSDAADEHGEHDPVILRVPDDWTLRVL